MGRQFPGCSHDWLLQEVLKKEVKIRIIPRPQSLVSSKHLSRPWQTCRIIRIATFPLCNVQRDQHWYKQLTRELTPSTQAGLDRKLK